MDLKLDYALESPEERVALVKKITSNTNPEQLSPKYLERLADYIVFAVEKEERKARKQKQIAEKSEILTDNRKSRINVRETSYEGLVDKLESGEDGIYNMITNDKNIIFQPKTSITEEDLAEIEPLRRLHDEIMRLEELSKSARGKQAYLLKKQIIEMRQDQYVIKGAFRKPIYCVNVIKNAPKVDFDENIEVFEDGSIISDGILSLFNEKHISALLCNYSRIKEDCWDKLNHDGKWIMEDLDALVESTLREAFPLYYDLLIYKIDGLSNAEIQEKLNDTFGIKHSVEYISSLWRNKIPKLLAQEAQNQYLVWYYTFVEKGKWKKCSKCGAIKLAHNNFFSRNKTSRDGFYSICKCCRNAKTKGA